VIVVFIAAMEPKNAPPFKIKDVAIKKISSSNKHYFLGVPPTKPIS
jgi:hypothetical protein